jgi:hypothetical protein
MMQRRDIVALVAGATVGMGGGTLGAFLVCTAGRAVARRFLDQLDDQYLDFGKPILATERHGAQQASLGGAPVTQMESHRSPRTISIASRD